jgi:transcriptional regulator with XRE-family HTH domain
MNKDLKAAIFKEFGTQGDFAQAINVDETLVSKIVRGRRKLDQEKQLVWAEALNSTPKELFGRDTIG